MPKETKYQHTADENCVYVLKLHHPSKKYTYIGSTQNFQKRIAQHNCDISFSKKSFTRRHSENGLHRWKPIVVISSSLMTRKLAYSLEKKLQTIKLTKDIKDKLGTLETADGKKCHDKIYKLVYVLNLPKWTQTIDVPAKYLPLTLTWYDPSFMPVKQCLNNQESTTLFPSYVNNIF